VSLPILVAPEPGEPLYLYIAAAAEAVSMVLVVERTTQEDQEPEGSGPATGVQTIQKPVYYVSEVLHEAKTRYLETHKLLYAMLVASKKLRHYFQAHRVVVVTSFLLRAILHNSNTTCNIAKWAAELAEFDWASSLATPSRARSWLTSSWNGHLPRTLLGVRIPIRTPHLRSLGVRSSLSPIGRSSSTDPPVCKLAEQEWSSSTQAEIK
jgi:hypothetical protein